MAKSVFYSFHYERDNWRVQQVMNMGVLEGQPLLNSQEWEEVKRKGDTAIENWIAEQMKYKSAVVVLAGAETATRPWVKYEIGYAWDNKKPLVGVRIHGLADRAGNSDRAGLNPFDQVTLQNGKKVSDYVTLHTPSGSTTQQVYASISANLATWASNAVKRS